MMMAMMMPSLVPMLLRYRQAIGTKSHGPVGWFTVLVGAGYFLVWTVFGIAVFPLGVGLATAGSLNEALFFHLPLACLGVFHAYYLFGKQNYLLFPE